MGLLGLKTPMRWKRRLWMGAGGLEPPQRCRLRILSPLRLPLPPCPRRRILDSRQFSLLCRARVPELDLHRHPAGIGGLWRHSRRLPGGGTPGPLRLDGEALDRDGQVRAPGGLWTGVPVLPWPDPVCAVHQPADGRPQRGLSR